MRPRLLVTLAALILSALPAMAQQEGLRRLDTGNDSRGWEGVGRINLGNRGFCTGALIAPQLVLTAAHCLFDRATGAAVDLEEIEFLAGWRNGRAAAYRGVRRVVTHPDYIPEGVDQIGRVANDLALLELDQPIRLPSVRPFEIDVAPARGDVVGVVSYARDRAEAPALQEFCHVIGGRPGVLVLSCNVDFGSSGAPVFTIRDGVARVVSVVSAKAELTGEKVALSMLLDGPLATLRAALDMPEFAARTTSPGGAKFLRP